MNESKEYYGGLTKKGLDDYIEDDMGNKIPYLKKDLKFFYRKITLLYGETESGKTTIIQEILYLLKDKIPNVLIFAPTNDANNLYTGKVKSPGIFKKLSIEILEEINERQKKCMKVYSIANDMETMKSIFLRVADERMKAIVNGVNRDAARYLQMAVQNYSDPGLRHAEEKKIRDMQISALKSAYKLCINMHKKTLMKDESLTDTQKIAVQFHDHCPDLLLVFDDCASFFKEHHKEPIIVDMFYAGRWNGLTSIFSFQGDKDIPPNLRRSAHTAIFTTSQCAMAHFNTASNGYDKQLRKKIDLAINRIFKQDGDMPTYRKLAFLRNEAEKIQCILADSYGDYRMGGLWVRKYLETLEPKSITSGSDKALINEILSMTK
jgi:energy-coupling factor transporter ATP-binding protein EcfA2